VTEEKAFRHPIYLEFELFSEESDGMTENTLKLIYIDFKIFKNSYKNTFRPSLRHLTGTQKAQNGCWISTSQFQISPSPSKFKDFNEINSLGIFFGKARGEGV
jgi:hypothetical protein